LPTNLNGEVEEHWSDRLCGGEKNSPSPTLQVSPHPAALRQRWMVRKAQLPELPP
jgi:hypothetical protein